jgi:aspartyl-tRNA(Asn)/glutamyl-tRNA(Gln) amidotransferase subunit C
MAIISKEEVLKIAQISNITVHEHEIESLTKELEDVLAYAVRVTQVTGDVPDSLGLMNINREDVAITTDTQKILALAPDRVEDYFVVPIILDQN